jgi:hypothetical protein
MIGSEVVKISFSIKCHLCLIMVSRNKKFIVKPCLATQRDFTLFLKLILNKYL